MGQIRVLTTQGGLKKDETAAFEEMKGPVSDL